MAERDKKFVLGFVKDKSLHLIKSIQGERGNGIDTVTVNESATDSGYNNITITFTDGVSKSFQVKNGTGITHIEQTVEAEVDGQYNVITVYLSNDTSFTFRVRNGSKGDEGPQGQTAVYDPNNPETPLFILDTIPGDSNVNGMTQAAITEFVNGRFIKLDSEDDMESVMQDPDYDPNAIYYTEEE